jgi:RHS repeat-associated protein
MMGYAAIRAHRDGSFELTEHDVGDACGPRAHHTAILNGFYQVLTSTVTRFDPPGAVAPFTCRAAETTVAACEWTPVCRERHAVYGYDAFGNVDTLVESSGAEARRTRTPVLANTTDYIVDRPARQETDAPVPGGWTPRSRTVFRYDDRPPDQPPGSRGNLTGVSQVTDLATGAAATTALGYDAAGNRVSTTGPTGIVSTTNYDAERALFPVSACTAVGCTGWTWDERLGVALTATDPNDQTVTTDYDAYTRPVRVTRPDGTTTTTTYLAAGTVSGTDDQRQRIRTEVADGSAGDGVIWREALLDGLGRTYRTRHEGPAPGTAIVADTRYADASDRPEGRSAPVIGNATGANPTRWTTYRYDAARRPTTVTHPGAAGAGRSFAYGPGTVEQRDELGNTVVAEHDGFGRTTAVIERARACPTCTAEPHTTAYTYDVADRLASIVDDAGLATTIERDDAGRETAITDPDRGRRTRTWRPDGALDTETDLDGTHTWSYDVAGRPTGRVDSGPAGTQTASWHYDTDPDTKAANGYSRDRLTGTTYSGDGAGGPYSGSDRYWYDRRGQVSRTRHCVDSTCRQMVSSHDPAGRLGSLVYPDPGNPDGERVDYTYDPAGRLKAVGSLLTNVELDASGQPTLQRLGNGLYEQRAYDQDRGWLTDVSVVTAPKVGTTRYSASYTPDAAGRVTQARTTNPTPQHPGERLETYAYDELGRLSTYHLDGTPPETYEYDAIGRTTASTATGARAYDDPAHPHALTGTSSGQRRRYDAAGNLRTAFDAADRTDLTWTPTGMPATITTATGSSQLAYDAEGQRVRRVAGKATTYFLGRYLEQDPKGLTRYYWAGDRLIARRDAAGTLTYVHPDRLGSTRLTTGPGAADHGRYNYGPHGQVLPDSVADDTAQRWQGQREEPDSHLVHMNARYYDPAAGQFTAADSVVRDAYGPQALNRYSFGEGDPVNTRDPSGHLPEHVAIRKEEARRSALAAASFAGGQCGNVFVTCIPGNAFVSQSWGTARATDAKGNTATAPYYREETTGGTDPDGSPHLGSWSSNTSLGTWTRHRPVESVVTHNVALAETTEPAPIFWESSAPVPRLPRAAPLLKAVHDFLAGIPSLAIGIEIDLSVIAPIVSNGGGTAGLNLVFTTNAGLELYLVTPSANPSYGLNLGSSVTLVGGWGHGPWSGPFNTVSAGAGPFTGSAFTSPSLPGWQGFQTGLQAGVPLPSASATQTIYTRLLPRGP